MNNSLHYEESEQLKKTYEGKLISIFTTFRKYENLTSSLPKGVYSDIIYDDNFNLDGLSTFRIFNEIVLRNLNIINLFIIQPAYKEINQSLISNMADILNLYSLIFIGFFTLFIASVLLFYFFDWRPLQNNLDSTVI